MKKREYGRSKEDTKHRNPKVQTNRTGGLPKIYRLRKVMQFERKEIGGS